MLDALVMGDLVHQKLERALRTLEVDGSLANAAPPVTQLGGETVNALTFEVNQSPGAGQQNSTPLYSAVKPAALRVRR